MRRGTFFVIGWEFIVAFYRHNFSRFSIGFIRKLWKIWRSGTILLIYATNVANFSYMTSYTIAVSGVHASADQEGDATEQRISDLNKITSSSFEKNGPFLNHEYLFFWFLILYSL